MNWPINSQTLIMFFEQCNCDTNIQRILFRFICIEIYILRVCLFSTDYRIKYTDTMPISLHSIFSSFFSSLFQKCFRLKRYSNMVSRDCANTDRYFLRVFWTQILISLTWLIGSCSQIRPQKYIQIRCKHDKFFNQLTSITQIFAIYVVVAVFISNNT